MGISFAFQDGKTLITQISNGNVFCTLKYNNKQIFCILKVKLTGNEKLLKPIGDITMKPNTKATVVVETTARAGHVNIVTNSTSNIRYYT